VVEYGMSEKMGTRVFGHKEDLVFLGRELGEHTKDYSEATANAIDQEVSDIIAQGLKKAEHVVSENRETLNKVTKELLEKETLSAEEFEQVMGKKKAEAK